MYSEQGQTIVGASTCIFRQLNSRAKIGFDNNTDMLRFLSFCTRSLLIMESTNLELGVSGDCSVALFGATDGTDTFAGRTALILHKIGVLQFTTETLPTQEALVKTQQKK